MWSCLDSGGLWPRSQQGLVDDRRIICPKLYRDRCPGGSSLNASLHKRTVLRDCPNTRSAPRSGGECMSRRLAPLTSWRQGATLESEGIKLSQIDARGVRRAARGLGVAGISFQLRPFWH